MQESLAAYSRISACFQTLGAVLQPGFHGEGPDATNITWVSSTRLKLTPRDIPGEASGILQVQPKEHGRGKERALYYDVNKRKIGTDFRNGLPSRHAARLAFPECKSHSSVSWQRRRQEAVHGLALRGVFSQSSQSSCWQPGPRVALQPSSFPRRGHPRLGATRIAWRLAGIVMIPR